MSVITNLKQRAYLLLRRSEKHTKTDMVYLAKGGGWLVVGQILSLTLLFGLSVVFANLLPKETYGNYKYVMSIAGILGALSLSGMNTAIAKAVAQGLNNSLRRSFIIQLKWGLLQFFVMLPVSYYYFTQGNNALALSALIIGSLVPIMNSANTYAGVLTGRKDFKTMTVFGVASSITTTLLLFLTMLASKNFVLLILIYFLGNSATNLFFYYKTIKKFQLPDSSDANTISFGKHLSLINLLPTVAFYIDGILIFHFLGATNLAIYNFAIAMPEQIKGFLKNIMSLTLPKFSEKSIKDIKSTLWRKKLYFTLGISGIIIIYLITAPYIFKIFFSEYLESIFYSQIFALSLLAMSSMTSRSVLISQTAKEQLYYLNIILGITQIVITFFLIYFYGIWGAVFSKILMRFFEMFLSAWYTKKI